MNYKCSSTYEVKCCFALVSQVCYVAQAGLKFTTLLILPPKSRTHTVMCYQAC